MLKILIGRKERPEDTPGRSKGSIAVSWLFSRSCGIPLRSCGGRRIHHSTVHHRIGLTIWHHGIRALRHHLVTLAAIHHLIHVVIHFVGLFLCYEPVFDM